MADSLAPTTTGNRPESPDPTLCSNMVLSPSTQYLADNARQPGANEDDGDDTEGAGTSQPRRPPDTADTRKTDDVDEVVDEEGAEGDEPSPAIVQTNSNKVSITLLLVSGRRRTVDFDPKITIAEMKETVWSTWPSDWSDELPPSSSFLRILYLGRILTDETTLASFNLPHPPEQTVFHVSVRSFAAASNDDDMKKKKKQRSQRRGRSSTSDHHGHEQSGSYPGPAGGSLASRGCCGCTIM